MTQLFAGESVDFITTYVFQGLNTAFWLLPSSGDLPTYSNVLLLNIELEPQIENCEPKPQRQCQITWNAYSSATYLHALIASKQQHTVYRAITKHLTLPLREQACVGCLLAILYAVWCCVMMHTLRADCSFNYFLPCGILQ